MQKKPLFILELANNHNGSIERGKKIISMLKAITKKFDTIFDFAIKLQYRNIETFIHPEFISETKTNCIKRLPQVGLTFEQSKILKDEIDNNGFISICTAFDEFSALTIEEQGFDYIKIASCSFCDYPLLEKIAGLELPIIASCAGVSLEKIKKTVKYFQSRNREIGLMHCVAKYPTPSESLELNQISLLKKEFPELKIGYSTHEAPDNLESIKIAVAKGAQIFEKHVGLDDYEGSINAYSATPNQIEKWLNAAKATYELCGIENERYICDEDEQQRLRNLTRGAFVIKDIKKGEVIEQKDIFLAVPSFENQVFPCELTQNKKFIAKTDIKANSPIYKQEIEEKTISYLSDKS